MENKYYTPTIDEFKICKQCNENKPLNSYRKVNNGTGLEGTCKKCAAERSRIYRIKNRKKAKLAQKKCYENKKQYYINKTAQWRKNNPDCRKKEYCNIKSDPFKYFRKLVRNRISQSFYSKSWNKNTKAEKILGCDYNTAFKHIENQFKSGMSWSNKSEWHIDHIIPLAYAKTEEELIKLCNYKNLQPLWVKDNLSKQDKITLNKSELKKLLQQLNIL